MHSSNEDNSAPTCGYGRGFLNIVDTLLLPPGRSLEAEGWSF